MRISIVLPLFASLVHPSFTLPTVSFAQGGSYNSVGAEYKTTTKQLTASELPVVSQTLTETMSTTPTQQLNYANATEATAVLMPLFMTSSTSFPKSTNKSALPSATIAEDVTTKIKNIIVENHNSNGTVNETATASSTASDLLISSQTTSTEIMSTAPAQQQNKANATVAVATLKSLLMASSTYSPETTNTSALTAATITEDLSTNLKKVITEIYNSSAAAYEGTTILLATPELAVPLQTTSTEMASTAGAQQQNNTNASNLKAMSMSPMTPSSTNFPATTNASILPSSTISEEVTTKISNMTLETSNSIGTVHEATTKSSTASELPATYQTTSTEIILSAPTQQQNNTNLSINATFATAPSTAPFTMSPTYSLELKNMTTLPSTTTEETATTKVENIITEIYNSVGTVHKTTMKSSTASKLPATSQTTSTETLSIAPTQYLNNTNAAVTLMPLFTASFTSSPELTNMPELPSVIKPEEVTGTIRILMVETQTLMTTTTTSGAGKLNGHLIGNVLLFLLLSLCC